MMAQGSGTKKRAGTVVLAVSVATMTLPQQLQASEPPAPRLLMLAPDAAAPRVGLRVDTEELGSQGETVGAKIEESARAVVEAEGFGDAEDKLDPVIVIVVERTGTEENPGFVVGFSIEKGDDIVPGSARQTDCSLCTRTELIERIEKELPGLLELARQHQVPAEAGGDGDGGGEDGGDEGDDGGGEDGKAIGALGFAGIGVGVAGLAGVGVGVALAVKGFEPREPDFLQRTNYRTPGNIVLAIGGAALIAGVVMIAVDVSKRKKARNHQEQQSRLQPHGAGFRF